MDHSGVLGHHKLVLLLHACSLAVLVIALFAGQIGNVGFLLLSNLEVLVKVKNVNFMGVVLVLVPSH